MKKTAMLFIVFLWAFTNSFCQNGIRTNSTKSKLDLVDTQKVPITVKGTNTSVFKTPEIILFNYSDKKRIDKITELTTLSDDLYDNSKPSIKNYLDDTIHNRIKRINKLKSEIATLELIQDSLYARYTKDFMIYRKVNFLNFGKLRSEAFFEYIYKDNSKKFKTLGNSGFNIGENTGSLYSEIVSGNLGLFRVSIGAMVSKTANKDSTKAKNEEAYQRLVTYGGNTVLNLEYPLALIHFNDNQYNIISRLVSKGTADFPAFGTATDSFAGSGSVGLDIYADASLSNNQLKFFLNFNFNRIYGTDVFKTNLGLGNNNFTFGQLSLGLVILDNLKLSFVVSTFGSENSLTNKHVIAGGQVLN